MQIVVFTALFVVVIMFGEWAIQQRRKPSSDTTATRYISAPIEDRGRVLRAAPAPSKPEMVPNPLGIPPETDDVSVLGPYVPDHPDDFAKMVAEALYDEEQGHYIQRVSHNTLGLLYYTPIRKMGNPPKLIFRKQPVLRTDADAELALVKCRETIAIWESQIAADQWKRKWLRKA